MLNLLIFTRISILFPTTSRNCYSTIIDNYQDSQNKSYKLLGRYDGTVQLFQAAQSVSSKHRAIFIEKLNLQSVQQYAQVWEEVRTNFLSENMRIRRISFNLIVKLTRLLLREGLVRAVRERPGLMGYDLTQEPLPPD